MALLCSFQFFNDAIYILFNVAFTAVPIVMLAIFDQGGLNRATLENDPKAYLSIAHGMFFNDQKFIQWILRALWNAGAIFAVVYWAIGIDDVSGRAGQNHGLWLTSTVIYTIIVLLVTLRLLHCCSYRLYSFCFFFVIMAVCIPRAMSRA